MHFSPANLLLFLSLSSCISASYESLYARNYLDDSTYALQQRDYIPNAILQARAQYVSLARDILATRAASPWAYAYPGPDAHADADADALAPADSSLFSGLNSRAATPQDPGSEVAGVVQRRRAAVDKTGGPATGTKTGVKSSEPATGRGGRASSSTSMSVKKKLALANGPGSMSFQEKECGSGNIGALCG